MFTEPTPPTQDAILPNVLSPDKWARRIATAWQKQVPSIFEVAALLESAQAELRKADFSKMVRNHLPFGRSTATKLIAIAKCDHLRNSEHVPHLPANWGTLFELTLLTEEQFQRGIASHKISLKTQRKDVKALRGDQPKIPSGSPSLRDQLAEATREIERLWKNGGDLFGAKDTPRDIANVLVKTLTAAKLKKVIAECGELLVSA